MIQLVEPAVESLDNRIVGIQVRLANGSRVWASVGNFDVANPRLTRHILDISIERNGEWFPLARYFDSGFARHSVREPIKSKSDMPRVVRHLARRHVVIHGDVSLFIEDSRWLISTGDQTVGLDTSETVVRGVAGSGRPKSVGGSFRSRCDGAGIRSRSKRSAGKINIFGRCQVAPLVARTVWHLKFGAFERWLDRRRE
jgi:hypothetical protein